MKVVCNKKSPVVFKNVAIGTCFAPSNNAERIYLKIANELLPLMDEDGSYVTAMDVEIAAARRRLPAPVFPL